MKTLSIFLTAVQRFLVLVLLAVAAASAQALPKGAAELLMYEQKYVNRTLDTDKIIALQNYQAQKYSPEKGKVFQVKSYWIDAEKLNVFEVPQALKDLKISFRRVGPQKQPQILMLVHPESETFFKALTAKAERGPKFEATATASSRTLMMWPQDQPSKVFFGKLSLNKEIGGVVRTIPQGEVARSLGVTQILDASKSILPRGFGYLPEFFGVMPKDMERGGMLLRSIPPDIMSGQSRAMPLFALYTSPGEGIAAPIETMIKNSGMDAETFVVEKILRPFAEQWVQLVVEHGIAIEAHAQNVLMEIGRDGLPTGKFIYRDFGGFNIDLKFRREHGLPVPALPVIVDEKKDYHQDFHQKAVVSSLQTYFEGGFLFGLGKELAREGYKGLDYEGLTQLNQNLVRSELRKKRVRLNGDFYENLMPTIERARVRVTAPANACPMIFLGS